MKSWHWLLVGGAVVAAYFLTRPKQTMVTGPAGTVNGVHTASTDPFAALLGLPDPANLPIGTKSPDGHYVVTQSRLAGSRPQWTAVLGGGVPGMIT